MTQPNSPICSVCIANYNGESLLIDCLDSVLNQQCSFPFEIIVHDDASTDKSLELLESRYPQIRLIKSSENVGFCVSNNRMVTQASGEFILLLNNDTALAPDALAVLYQQSQSQANPGILTLPQYDWESGLLVDRGCLLDPFYNPVPNLDATRRQVAMVIGACLWIPRTLWIQLGGFPEWFESIAEDMQICCRARLSGFTVEVTEKSSYWHRQGNSFGGNRVATGKLKTTYRRRRLSERNKTYVMALCTPQSILWFVFPAHLFVLTLEGLLLSFLKFDRRLLSEIYANVLRSLIYRKNQITEERRSIQASRAITAWTYQTTFTIWPHKLRMLIRHGIPGLS